MSVRIPINMTLPKDLVDALDAMAGPRGRSAFVEEAVRDQLRRAVARRAWQNAVGLLDPGHYPEWSTSEKVREWVRERRREMTDPGSP